MTKTQGKFNEEKHPLTALLRTDAKKSTAVQRGVYENI